MPLDVEDINPLAGQMSCKLWENHHINLPLSLYYSMDIPLAPFNSGHDYVEQPTVTSFIIDWMILKDQFGGRQESNWKNLVNKQFSLSYEDGTAQGTIYLGFEHQQFNSEVKFLSLNGTTFDIELRIAPEFDMETVNLDADGFLTLRCAVNFDGLQVYHTQLPTLQKAPDQLSLIGKFVDLGVYQANLERFENNHVDWKHLKPKP
ncbi:hypothetical protein [Paraflavitalea pollutisoli]|uniref:hypothetical protein n=1 Tax=Paraflavitalea pollutisoli TaxID=3034143 RepID=UPI0023EA8753|nr:hypothetical protein [Paraflavitalea sp. H1-2-19X]